MYACVQVKVCEGCGMLWFREQERSDVYCSRCVRKLADFPTPGSRKLRGRKSGKAGAKAGVSASADAGDATLPPAARCE
jgi:hypothetical protein